MKQPQISDVPTVRILLLGDKGVGKTTLTNLLASSDYTPTPASRTVGSHSSWTLQVRLHEYASREGMPPTPTWTSTSSNSDTCLFSHRMPALSEILYFVEFYDLNSSLKMPREHRNRLYRRIDGIIPVYNCLDMKSHDNLHDWLYEPLKQICKYRHRRVRPILRRHHVPILVVGTRMDKLKKRRLKRSGSIANQLGAEELLLNCLDKESLGSKTRNEGKIRRFLNQVVEFKQQFPQRPRF